MRCGPLQAALQTLTLFAFGRYPFAEQITKSHLFSVGSMHAWPYLLAMLVWMVELVMCCDKLDVDSDDFSAEKTFFDYLAKTYDWFLAGNDSYDDMDKELETNFSKHVSTLPGLSFTQLLVSYAYRFCFPA